MAPIVKDYTPEKVVTEGQKVETEFTRGFISYATHPNFKQCLVRGAVRLDHAVLLHSTWKMAVDLNLISPSGDDLGDFFDIDLINLYRNRVLSPYYPNAKNILDFRTKSQKSLFFQEIGKRIPGPSSQDPYIRGSDYLRQYFN